jgi:hypothetical protein
MASREDTHAIQKLSNLLAEVDALFSSNEKAKQEQIKKAGWYKCYASDILANGSTR